MKRTSSNSFARFSRVRASATSPWFLPFQNSPTRTPWRSCGRVASPNGAAGADCRSGIATGFTIVNRNVTTPPLVTPPWARERLGTQRYPGAR